MALHLLLQVVWSTSREVGCGYHLCPTLALSTFTNAYYLVCNYGPPSVYFILQTFNYVLV